MYAGTIYLEPKRRHHISYIYLNLLKLRAGDGDGMAANGHVSFELRKMNCRINLRVVCFNELKLRNSSKIMGHAHLPHVDSMFEVAMSDHVGQETRSWHR